MDFSNKYFNSTEPWNVIKENKKQCEELCYQFLILITNINILLNPFIPNGTNQVANWIGLDITKYDFTELQSLSLKEFNPLYSRILE